MSQPHSQAFSPVRLALPLIALVAALALVGPAQPGNQQGDDHGARHYVGAIANAPGSALFGLAIEDGEAVAYVCSNDHAFNKAHARWYRGQVVNGKFEAASPDGQSLTAIFKDRAWHATIKAKGKELSAEAAPVPAKHQAGVYRSADEVAGADYVTGWVIGLNGENVGARQKVKAVKDQNLQVQPAPGLNGIKAVPPLLGAKVTIIETPFQLVSQGEFIEFTPKWSVQLGKASDFQLVAFDVKLTLTTKDGQSFTDTKSKLPANTTTTKLKGPSGAITGSDPQAFTIQVTAFGRKGNNKAAGPIATATKSQSFP
jgi:hypothetical protein